MIERWRRAVRMLLQDEAWGALPPQVPSLLDGQQAIALREPDRGQGALPAQGSPRRLQPERSLSAGRHG